MQSDPDSGAMASAGSFATAVQIDGAPVARHHQRFGWALIPIVAASGFAGLGYEIVWTRQLSLALGTEMMAVLGAVAGFFGGLALGAFALDRPIRRARSPRTVYAALEAVIGLWGLVSVWLLPIAGRALAPLLGTEPAPVLLWAASFALPTLVLLPATVAMGGTLTALERMTRDGRGEAPRQRRRLRREHRRRRGRNAGFHVLADSGARTFRNAALPRRCERPVRVGDARDRTESDRTIAAADEARPGTIGGLRLVITLFATGLLGIAFEVLVVRLAAQVMQDTVYTFAGLLAAYLLGTAAGGLVWQRAGRHARDGSLGWLLAGTALACLTTAFLTPFIARIAETAAKQASPANWLSRWCCSWRRRPRWAHCSAYWRNRCATSAGRSDGRSASTASALRWRRC